MKRAAMILFVLFAISGCFAFRPGESEFQSAGKLVQQRKYSQATAAYDKLARDEAGTDLGARALFAAATVRVSYDNPHKDYALALQQFEEFIRYYPKHDLFPDAENWIFTLKSLLDLKHENERLQQNIEQLKRLDIRHEQRRSQ